MWSAATARVKPPANDAAEARARLDRAMAERRPVEVAARPAPQPGPALEAPVESLKALLRIEAGCRAAPDLATLGTLAVEELRQIVAARQVMLMRLVAGAPVTSAIAGSSSFERAAPLIGWLEKMTERATAGRGVGQIAPFNLAELARPGERAAHPFPFALWLPARFLGGAPAAGFLALRDTPWSDGDIAVGGRVADIYAQAAAARGAIPAAPRRTGGRLLAGAALFAALAGTMGLPVSGDVTLVGEVVPVGARPVVALAAGVVADIAVAPDRPVAAGDVVVRFDRSAARARLEAADREFALAETALGQILRAALVDPAARRDIAAARARAADRRTARDAAAAAIDTVDLRAPVAGLAHVVQPLHWPGRRVAAGEEILSIVEPGRAGLRLGLAAEHLALATVGAKLRVAVADDPGTPRTARVTAVEPPPAGRAGPGQAAVVVARFEDGLGAPRHGLAATARLSGEPATLGQVLAGAIAGMVRSWRQPRAAGG